MYNETIEPTLCPYPLLEHFVTYQDIFSDGKMSSYGIGIHSHNTELKERRMWLNRLHYTLILTTRFTCCSFKAFGTGAHESESRILFETGTPVQTWRRVAC